MWVIELPASIRVTKDKPFYLNLNVYRNAHYHTLNKAKTMFEQQVTPLLKILPKLINVELTYTLFTKTKQLSDVSNVCSIVDKFFCDSLVNLGYLPDDNYNHLSKVVYCFGGVDKDNPRVEVSINPIEIFKEDDMQITLVEAEIKQAIKDYIHSQINIKDGMEIIIDLKATRGDDGTTAIIDIQPEQIKEETPAKVTGTRTRATKAADPVKEVVKEAVKEPVKEEVASNPVASSPTGVEDGTPATSGNGEVETAAVDNGAAEEVTQEAPPTQPAQPTATEATQADGEAPAPRQSLFGNLKKPVN